MREFKSFSVRVTAVAGRTDIVSIVSSPEIYVNEWASFTTKDFPENRQARSGDKVKIIMTDVPDRWGGATNPAYGFRRPTPLRG